jgi:hypothetical protein
MVILLYKNGDPVRVEETDKETWLGYGYAEDIDEIKQAKKTDREEAIEKAGLLGLGDKDKLKKLSTKVIKARINKVEV